MTLPSLPARPVICFWLVSMAAHHRRYHIISVTTISPPSRCHHRHPRHRGRCFRHRCHCRLPSATVAAFAITTSAIASTVTSLGDAPSPPPTALSTAVPSPSPESSSQLPLPPYPPPTPAPSPPPRLPPTTVASTVTTGSKRLAHYRRPFSLPAAALSPSSPLSPSRRAAPCAARAGRGVRGARGRAMDVLATPPPRHCPRSVVSCRYLPLRCRDPHLCRPRVRRRSTVYRAEACVAREAYAKPCHRCRVCAGTMDARKTANKAQSTRDRIAICSVFGFLG